MEELTRVARGLWRPADQVADLAGTCAALLSISPPGSVVAGRAAAELHGLWLPPALPGPVELIVRRDEPVPRSRSHCTRAQTWTRRKVLHPDDVVIVDGLPVTSGARTWFDLADRLSMPDLIALGDSVLRGNGGDTDATDLRQVLSRARHKRGVVRARDALPLLNPRSRSRPESHLRYALVSHGLPEPRVNEAIYSDTGEWLAEPDLHYKRARLAIEYNGAVHADPQRMRKDITREIDIRHRGGWQTLTVGPAEVFKRPERTAIFVAELLRRRPVAIHRTA